MSVAELQELEEIKALVAKGQLTGVLTFAEIAGALGFGLALVAAFGARGLDVEGRRDPTLPAGLASARSPRLALRRTGRERGRLVSTSRSEFCRSATCA